MTKVLITTVPFGDKNNLPIKLLELNGIDYIINPIGRKLREDELLEMVADVEVLIAGTESITRRVMQNAPNLKLISRVGVGLDSVDLVTAEQLGIKVSYTPDAPAPAVAELTIGLMISLVRAIHLANLKMHQGEWSRFFGRKINDLTIGIIGAGRIGKRVIHQLHLLGVRRLLVNDINLNALGLDLHHFCDYVDKDYIYREADLISFHVPLTSKTMNMVCREDLLQMKSDAMIVNTSRGGIVNENDLFEVMSSGHLFGAAMDVFCEEPYRGRLTSIDRCLLTSHMGSMSVDCRAQMEIEATEEAIRFLLGKPLKGLVPEAEYQVQRESL